MVLSAAERRSRRNTKDEVWRKKHPDHYRRWFKGFYAQVKRDCFEAYGNGRCSICGETTPAFLALCFPNRDKKTLVARINKYGGGIYYQLKRAGFPKDPPIEVRCLNCNQKLLAHEHPKLQCFRHYGGDPPHCACCGLTDPELLTLDHVDGNGNKHRKQVRRRGTDFHKRLVKLGFPDNPRLQVLCWNCNRATWANGGICPHKAVGP
jgi:hypothetical protein